MFNQLTALGIGVVTFAIVIGVGVIVLGNFESSIATCASGFNYTATSGKCQNSTVPTDTASANTGAQTTYYLRSQLGSSGLAGWTPAIIALAVGLLFLGAFLIGKGGKGRQY